MPVQTVRNYTAAGTDPEEAIRTAVDDCIANNILAEELQANKAEVTGMLLSGYDENKLRELFLTEDGTSLLVHPLQILWCKDGKNPPASEMKVFDPAII